MSSSSIENLNNEEDKKFITQIRSHPKFVETKVSKVERRRYKCSSRQASTLRLFGRCS